VKWSERLSNRLSIIIIRYINHMKLLLLWRFLLSYSFIFFWFHVVSLYIWLYVLYVSAYFCKLCIPIVMLCILIVMHLFVSLSILNVMYVPSWIFCLIVLFCVLFVCKCVLYYCHRVLTQLQLINISYISYHIISYNISYHIISYHTN
jgi:hypothetical protein